MTAWDQIKTRLQGKLSSEAYTNWIDRTAQGKSEGHCLWVQVPDEVTRQWMQEAYLAEILQSARDLGLPYQRIQFEVAAAFETVVSSTNHSFYSGSNGNGFPVIGSSTQLNPKFSFDSFVVGSSNQFAHAAAQAVANNPARTYNPLFIYGGVGIGKTHLMHAIGQLLQVRSESTRVVYTSSERFMNEMISCFKNDRMSAFHRYYRSADVLLIDDIHVLAGRERTQEEFFHTFNELYDHQKQIVISSDSPPKSIAGLVERLRSRFEWGLMVDIQPPDLETKMAILDRKAEMEGVQLPEDVRVFIATKVKSNVRELEGALVKLVAYSSVTGSPITLTMAQQVLKHLVHGPEKRVTMDAIIRAVAEKYDLQPAQIKQKTNARNIARPRQVAMYLIKDMVQASLPEIGRAFGGKHHTTVLHSVQTIDKLRAKDPDLNRIIHSIIDSFH
jgi:chromosomal replication initiator protein